MSFANRAIKYIWRKKGKSFILLFIFIIINCMNISMLSILRVTKEAELEIKKNTQAKITLEVKENDNLITKTELEKILAVGNIIDVNRVCKDYAIPQNFKNYKGKIEDDIRDNMVTLYGYDDLSQDSRFSELEMKITSGETVKPMSQDSVVINHNLAELNSLQIGDIIEFSKNDRTISGKICGIYKSSIEDKQRENITSFFRIENMVFLSQTLMEQLVNEGNYNKVVLYVQDPEKLEDTVDKVKSLLGEKIEVSTTDTMYEKLKMNLDQIEKITNVILILVVIISVIVITLIYGIWIRDRKKEIAILLSLGKSKVSVFLQICLESFMLFGCSVILAVLVGNIITTWIERALLTWQDSRIGLNINLNVYDIVKVIAIGSLVLIISISLSLVRIIMAKPREVLAEMEG